MITVCYSISLLLLPHHPRSLHDQLSILLLTFTTTIIRSELLTFLFPLTLILILKKRLTIKSAVVSGAIGGFVGLGMTVGTDRWFYGEWVWSEVQAVVFNVVEGKSSEWGVSLW